MQHRAAKHGKSPSVQGKRSRRRMIFLVAALSLFFGAAFYSAHLSFPVDGNPSWSPDGRRVAFVHVPRGLQASGPKVIYGMNADGANVRRLSRWWLSFEMLGQLFTPSIRAIRVNW